MIATNAPVFVQSRELLKEHGKSETLLNTQGSSITDNLNWSLHFWKQ